MPTRRGHARWEGSLKRGAGRVDFGNGAFSAPYSAASRFESGAGTNPEELIAAAHAACFSMALSLVLGEAGHELESVDTTAHVTIVAKDGGFAITESRLVCEAKVPGIDEPTFQKHAAAAKAGCPVSRALAGVAITLEAKLASG